MFQQAPSKSFEEGRAVENKEAGRPSNSEALSGVKRVGAFESPDPLTCAFSGLKLATRVTPAEVS